MISQAIKSERQIRYKPNSETERGFYQTKETPTGVGLGLLIHKKTRSKGIVNILADLNLSIDYDNIIRILTDIADAVCMRMEENNGVYVPHKLCRARQFTLPLITVILEMTLRMERTSSMVLLKLCISNPVMFLLQVNKRLSETRKEHLVKTLFLQKRRAQSQFHQIRGIHHLYLI